jgi:sirohydrochlorin cobaltochelatase
MVQNQPSGEAALAAVRASGATSVQFIPLLLVAGEHIRQDIMGDNPKSWKSRLEAGGTIKVLDIPSPGLGYRDNIVQIYLDHLDQALQTLAP